MGHLILLQSILAAILEGYNKRIFNCCDVDCDIASIMRSGRLHDQLLIRIQLVLLVGKG